MSTIKQRIENSLSNTSPRILKSHPLSVAFILFALIVIYFASQFPDTANVGPGAFPILISLGIIAFAVVDILAGGETEMKITDLKFGPPAVVLGLLIVYLALMPITGFLVGTMLYLPAILYYSNVESKPLIVGLTVGLPILLFYIFARIFLVPLPAGIIPISRLLPPLPLVVMF